VPSPKNQQIPPILQQHLPPSMLKALPLLPEQDQPLILLTRHSIRESAPNNGFASYKLPLTDVGRDLALVWGQYLAEQTQRTVATCVSSPIPRCVDTATLMLDGYALALPHHLNDFDVAEHNLLVEPGSFVLDVSLAGPQFIQYGALKFINAFLNNQLAGMKMPMQGVQDILRLLFEHLPKQPSQLSLAVSHDTILAAMFSLMAGHSKIERQDWPLMMEGAFLWFEGETFEDSVVHWLWRGEKREFRPREF
jgi:broad specificity phosphatase PhoE